MINFANKVIEVVILSLLILLLSLGALWIVETIIKQREKPWEVTPGQAARATRVCLEKGFDQWFSISQNGYVSCGLKFELEKYNAIEVGGSVSIDSEDYAAYKDIMYHQGGDEPAMVWDMQMQKMIKILFANKKCTFLDDGFACREVKE